MFKDFCGFLRDQNELLVHSRKVYMKTICRAKFSSLLLPSAFHEDTGSQLQLANLIFLNSGIQERGLYSLTGRWPLRSEIKLRILREIHTSETSTPLIAVSLFEEDCPSCFRSKQSTLRSEQSSSFESCRHRWRWQQNKVAIVSTIDLRYLTRTAFLLPVPPSSHVLLTIWREYYMQHFHIISFYFNVFLEFSKVYLSKVLSKVYLSKVDTTRCSIFEHDFDYDVLFRACFLACTNQWSTFWRDI